MEIAAAIRAVAPHAPLEAIDGLVAVRDKMEELGALANATRAAHLIGQCAHESMGFLRSVESLFYTSGDRIFAVFERHFESIAHAEQFARNQEKLGNHVYANRMGNGGPASGDGFRYRGRGYIQLTGRDNYRIFGERVGIALEQEPERATQPATAWLLAASYFANRSKAGRTTLEWADDNNVEMVTRIVNGGVNGLSDRRDLTARALTALGVVQERPPLKKGATGPPVFLLQRLLAQRGFSPGALDGNFGKKTEQAVKDFQTHAGLPPTGRVDPATWSALTP